MGFYVGPLYIYMCRCVYMCIYIYIKCIYIYKYHGLGLERFCRVYIWFKDV